MDVLTRPDDDPAPTADLARAAQAGDARQFERLYERVAPQLWAWAALRAPADVEPGDLLGEVWLRAVQSLRTHDAESHEFRAWLFGIAKHVLLQVLRERSRAPRANASAGSSTLAGSLDACPQSVTAVSTRLARDEALAAFLERVRALDPTDRDILVHCGLEGFTCVETATRLGLSAEAATKRWQRLRAELRDAAWVRELLLESA